MILRGVMKAIKKNEEECKITITIEITIKDGKQIISNQKNCDHNNKKIKIVKAIKSKIHYYTRCHEAYCRNLSFEFWNLDTICR